MTTPPAAPGSAAPGDPRAEALVVQLAGSSGSPAGSASTRENPNPSGPIGQGVYVRFIDAAAATGLQARLGAEAGRTSFRW